MFKFPYISLLILLLFISCTSTKKSMESSVIKADNTDMQSEEEVKFQFFYLDGAKEFMLQNYAQARELFEMCIEIKPKSAASLYYLSKVYLESGNPDQAIIFAKSACLQNAKNIWYKIHLVKLYNYVGKYDQSSLILENLIKEYPTNENLYFELTDLYLNQKRFTEAISLLNNFEKKIARTKRTSEAKIQIYFQIQDYSSLLSELKVLVNQEPDNIKYRLLLAEVYAQESKLSEAKNAFQDLLMLAPNDSQAQLSASFFYFNLQEYSTAFELQKKAFANTNGDIKTKLQLFYKLTTIGDSDIYNQQSVMDLLNILSEAHPDDAQIQEIRLNYLMLNQDNNSARKQILEILHKNKSNFDLWKELLLIDSELNDYDAITEHATEALVYFPNQAIVYYFLGFALNKNKNYEESVIQLETALDYLIDNKDFEEDILLLLAESYYKSGKVESSYKTFDKILFNNPLNSLALNNYSFYLSLEKQNLTQAVEMAKKANELVQNNANFLDTYAWALFQSQNYLEALAVIEKAIHYGGSSSSTITEHYGDILSILKQKEKALTQWNLSKTLGNNSEILKQKILLEKYIEK